MDYISIIFKIVEVLIIILAAKILILFLRKAVWKIETLTKRIVKYEVNREKNRLVFRFISFLIWLCALTLIIFVSGFWNLFISLIIGSKWYDKVFQISLIWVLSYLLIKHFSGVFEEFDKAVGRISFSENTHVLLKLAIRYGIITLAIIFSLQALNLTTVLATVLAGAGVAGIVIGFAAKDVFSNLLAGIFIIVDRPFKIGEYVSVEGENIGGTVKEIRLRSTKLISADNTLITVPNSLLANNPVINYSRFNFRHLFIKIGIAYESDLKKAFKILKQVCKNDEAVIKGKEISVVINEFASSSVNITAKIWVDKKKGGGVFETKSRILENIKRAFDKNNIEIPYPKQVLLRPKKTKRK